MAVNEYTGENAKKSSSIGSSVAANTHTKRSMSALTTVRPSPTRSDDLLALKASTLNYNTNFQLYSKSASSMKEMTGSIKSLLDDAHDHLDDSCDKEKSKFFHAHAKNSGTSVSSSSSGYKYTPLRQSWTNLTQMNNLSPHSVSNSSANMGESQLNSNRRTLFEENSTSSLNEEYRDRIGEQMSPSIPRTTRKITTNRPMTADSILSRHSGSKSSADFGVNAKVESKTEPDKKQAWVMPN